eukprot:scpid89857/ scgid13965/ 
MSAIVNALLGSAQSLGGSVSNASPGLSQSVVVSKSTLGASYTYNVYIDKHCVICDKPDEARPEVRTVTVSADQIQDIDPWESFDDNECLQRIYLYKNPLYKRQITQCLLFHSFVVFQTKSHWWSFEKNGDGVTVQRSTTKQTVRDYYRRDRRTGYVEGRHVRFVLDDDVTDNRQTLNDVMQFMRKTNLVSRKYNVIRANCQDFAKALVNNFAREKKWTRGKWRTC